MREQARQAVMLQDGPYLEQATRALRGKATMPLTLVPPVSAHVPRGQVKRQGGATYARWMCKECDQVLIHVGKTPTTSRPVYASPPECSKSRMSVEQWLLEDVQKKKGPPPTVPTPPYPWHRSPAQYAELLAQASPVVSASATTTEAAMAPAVPGAEEAHVAGTSTAMFMAANSQNPEQLRQQVSAEMQRVQTYMESLAGTMKAVEEAHHQAEASTGPAAAAATPVPPEDLP